MTSPERNRERMKEWKTMNKIERASKTHPRLRRFVLDQNLRRCKSVSQDPRFGRCVLNAGHEGDEHEPIWGNTWTTEEQANR